MKKLLTFMLISALLFSVLTACGGQGGESSAEESLQESESSEVSEESIPDPAPEYWGFNGYETAEQPNAPEEVTGCKMKFKRDTDTQYSLTFTTDAGDHTVTFYETLWGTYNLGAWRLKDEKNKMHIFVAGSTDLEYVYRVSGKPSGGWVWSGGNHGNETILSLEFYDGETEEKIELKKGESKEINLLHVIEKTNLLWTADSDGDGYGFRYKDKDKFEASDVYAEVTRKYTFAGPMIKLNVDYKYVKDAYHYLSYTCMFPIDKKYGLYCDMIDKDGNKVKTVETLKVGKADYSGPMNSGNAATRALIYGYTDERYSFDVRVNTYADSLENQTNKFKTAFWDMNTSSNKLYFSKFDDSKASKIDAGTELHTECIWQFVFTEDK
jgi:hypothetical protein